VDIILDPKIGVFFPYYAKSERPQLFERLMRKQNSDMSSSSVIPVFGLTEQASSTIVEDQNGKKLTVSEAILIHPNIRKIEKTASSAELGKYLLIIDRYVKEQAKNYIDSIFELVPELENQPAKFKRPQRGGNAFKKASINSINNFLNKLEEKLTMKSHVCRQRQRHDSSSTTQKIHGILRSGCKDLTSDHSKP
jgi:hypothetical protein